MRVSVVIKENKINYFVSDFTKQSIKMFNNATNVFNGDHGVNSFFYFSKGTFVDMYPNLKHILKWDLEEEKEMFDFEKLLK